MHNLLKQRRLLAAILALATSVTFATALTFAAHAADPWLVTGRVDVAEVTEPSTYAMLLAGLGLLGFVARYRKH